MKNLPETDKDLNAYIDNELGVTEKQELEANLTKNPSLQIKLAELHKISNYLQIDRNDESICQNIKIAVRQVRVEEVKKPLLWLRWTLPATVGLILGLVFIVSYFHSPNITTEDFYAQYQAAFDDVLAYTDEDYNHE